MNTKFCSMMLFAATLFFSCTDNYQSETADETIGPVKLTDAELMDKVQYHTFQYFWEGAEPNSGMALERIHLDGSMSDEDYRIVTAGGSGFGLMAIIVGVERGFIERDEAVERFETIVTFLENADRYKGVWPHWMYGDTGETRPFSARDDGGDLVETAFLIQGLLTVRQYLRDGSERERAIADRIHQLWLDVDWNWYTKNGEENVLYWHWSPNHDFGMNHHILGYDETLITYILAASSPSHPIDAAVYHEGWARGGEIVHNDHEAYGVSLPFRHNGAVDYSGPLFWAHYSYLGLDPRNLEDAYGNFWENNRNHALIHYYYAIENPKQFEGYGEDMWGLTASYSTSGYTAHKPHINDLGVITPTAALSSFPYTPEESMKMMRNLYDNHRQLVFGKYGFIDALSFEENWFPQRYLAIDQGPIVVMIENHRSGLLWDLFMTSEEIIAGLDKLGFSY